MYIMKPHDILHLESVNGLASLNLGSFYAPFLSPLHQVDVDVEVVNALNPFI